MDDAERRLFQRARRRDRAALASLYDRYRGRLLGFLVKMTWDRQAAEDVFQEVWVKLLQGIATFDPEAGHFRAWLFRIASNAAVDYRRREGRRRTEDLEAPHDGETSQGDTMASDDPGPERLTASEESGRALQIALASLPVRQRTAVLLRHQQGLSYAEVAHALGVPEGTAKTLVHRGVTVLRTALRQRGVVP